MTSTSRFTGWPALLATILGLAFSSVVFAATVTDPTLLEQQKSEQQKFEEEVRKRLQPPTAPRLPKPEAPLPKLLPGDTCQAIQNIWLYGADQLSKSKQRKLVRSFVGQCLTNAGIGKLVDAVQEVYLQAGYTTTRVGLKEPQSSLDRGNLELWVVEGRINKIILNEDGPFDRSRVKAAFPVGAGDVLNIHALDQGMEQLGRLYSQKFRMQILPAAQPGYSDIQLVEYFESDMSFAPDGSRYRTGREQVLYSYNNGGTEETGVGLGQVKYTTENLWGRNDSLSVSAQLSTPFAAGERENQVWQVNGSVPNGNWLYDGMLYYGKTVRIVPGVPTQFMSRSDTLTTRLSANRMLFRNQRNKLEGFARFEFSDRKNFINDTVVQVSSRKVASVDVGLMYTRYMGRGTLVMSPSASRGVPWLGAIGDSASLSTSDPHAEYQTYGMYAFYRRDFSIANRSAFGFETAFNSQYSSTGLYGEKQFVVGGDYSVRGFRKNVLSDDNGWTLRNDLVLPIGEWTQSMHKSEKVLPLKLKLFYDAGNTYAANGSKLETLSGWGYGMSYRYRWFDLYLNRSHAIDSSPLFTSPEGWITSYGIRISTIF